MTKVGTTNGEMDSEDQLLRYLQGDMNMLEQEQFEAASAGNVERSETIRAYSQLLDRFSDQLVEIIPPTENDPRLAGTLRSRILSIAEQHDVKLSRVVRADDGGWLEAGTPGVQFKVLFKEPDTGRVTALFRSGPGARMPAHKHVGLEECLVLEGSLYTDGILLHAGDYIVTEDQTIHEDTWTETGALVLLKTMMMDEMLVG